ncbi:substrate-binding periplasmic protein [Kordiimonas aquimaris]|uniref:substrate-binding periplasmic protein n=1 Tax=Kordiimonas aquimaris TaxID=707591 RepID=UPI0021D0B819|nr:transporter substrate-binding domain-containing protein [Kordiimonas aquimaris]
MNKFRYIKIGMLLSVALMCGAFRGVFAQDVVVYTEHYPPFNYLNENGEVDGLATAKVKQILDAANITYDIHMVPWPRAMQLSKTQDNALIYTITRTPSREKDFHWLVPFAPTNFHVYMRAGDNREMTSEALRAGAYTGSCIVSDISCELLAWIGMPTEKIIPNLKQSTGDFRMVIARRADFYVSEFVVNDQLRKLEGYDVSLTKPVMKLDVETGFYLAGSRELSTDVRNKIRTAYGALLDSGAYSLLDLTKSE